MLSRRHPSGQIAFTLIELLVVITIVAVLATLVLPMLGRIQVRGYETKTMSNMRVMGVALLTYAGDNSYQLPGRVAAVPGSPEEDVRWPVLLKPYIQDLTIYCSPIPDANGKSYKVTDQTLYTSNKTNYTSYIYNGGNDQATDASGNITYPRLNVIGQPSQTILLGVPLPQANNFYMDFTEGNNSQILNKTAFGDGTPYVFADGSSRTLAVVAKEINTAEPKSSGAYTDWLWLFDKSQTSIIH